MPLKLSKQVYLKVERIMEAVMDMFQVLLLMVEKIMEMVMYMFQVLLLMV